MTPVIPWPSLCGCTLHLTVHVHVVQVECACKTRTCIHVHVIYMYIHVYIMYISVLLFVHYEVYTTCECTRSLSLIVCYTSQSLYQCAQETEQALKRELGLEGGSQMDTSHSHSPLLPPVPQRSVSLS